MHKYKIAGISLIVLVLVAIALYFISTSPTEFRLYLQLDGNEQELYDLIYSKLSTNTNTISLEKDYTISQVQNVRDALYYDHPELYKYDFGDIVYKDSIIEFPILYNTQQQSKIEAVLDSLKDITAPVELYNWCVDNIEYITEESYTKDNHTIYGALINKKAVCEGIARTYSLLLSRNDILNTTVSGSNHMWNYVWYNGEWHSIDITTKSLDAPRVATCTVSETGKVFNLPEGSDS